LSLLRSLRAGDVALLTGPSGGGKSAILRAIGTSQPRPCILRAPTPEELRARDRAVIDLFPRLSLQETLRTLARAGLAEARLFTLKPRDLSEGQLHRLACATAWARASRAPRAAAHSRATACALTSRGSTRDHSNEPHAILLLDEFASPLDRPTAHAFGASLRRAISASRLALVAATAHDDMIQPLAPDHLVLCAPGSPPALHSRKAAA
jgi:ABC-type ATPase with predicted acetyltransferase domain